VVPALLLLLGCAFAALDERKAVGVQAGDAGVLERQRIAAAEVDHRVVANLAGVREDIGEHVEPGEVAADLDQVATAVIIVMSAAAMPSAVTAFTPSSCAREIGDDVRPVAKVEHERVAPLAAGHNVDAKAAEQPVVALAAAQDVVALVARQHVVAFAACQAVIAVAAPQAVVAVATVQLVVAPVAIELVITLAAFEFVVAVLAGQLVVASFALDRVVTSAADQDVSAARAFELVVAGCTDRREGLAANVEVEVAVGPVEVLHRERPDPCKLDVPGAALINRNRTNFSFDQIIQVYNPVNVISSCLAADCKSLRISGNDRQLLFVVSIFVNYITVEQIYLTSQINISVFREKATVSPIIITEVPTSKIILIRTCAAIQAISDLIVTS
jgi:hypothetical protein